MSALRLEDAALIAGVNPGKRIERTALEMIEDVNECREALTDLMTNGKDDHKGDEFIEQIMCYSIIRNHVLIEIKRKVKEERLYETLDDLTGSPSVW